MIILSPALGRADPKDLASETRAYALVARLIHRVETSRGSSLSPGILGDDLFDEEARARALESGEFERCCRAAAAEVTEILDRLLRETREDH